MSVFSVGCLKGDVILEQSAVRIRRIEATANIHLIKRCALSSVWRSERSLSSFFAVVTVTSVTPDRHKTNDLLTLIVRLLAGERRPVGIAVEIAW